MQRVQRRFGRFMKRSADESQVAVLLRDFEEANELLGRIIDSTSAWRDAWESILTYQSQMVKEFELLYSPIVGASEDSESSPRPVETRPETYARTLKLKEEYEEMRRELMGELYAVDDRMIRPATSARDYLSPMKKTIKKRDDRKLDYERYSSRRDNYYKKNKLSDRDRSGLAKVEEEFNRASEEYNEADEHLRRVLPPLLSVTWSLFPHIMNAQIDIQNKMLANYYTIVFNFSQEADLPSPPPSMEEIIQQWELDNLPVQQEIETFGCIANSKKRRKSQDTESGYPQSGNGSLSSLSVNGNGANGRPTSSRRPSNVSNYSQSTLASNYRPPSSHSSYRRPSGPPSISGPPSPGRSSAPPVPILETKPRINNDVPSASSSLTVPSTIGSSQTPLGSPGGSISSVSRSDYFGRGRQPSQSSAVSQELTSVLANKKKPPPPPPSKPAGLSNAIFVTALYDFGGEGVGDLAFREGDRIRVLKKTNSTDDWWEGQLHGVKGSFPANYVE